VNHLACACGREQLLLWLPCLELGRVHRSTTSPALPRRWRCWSESGFVYCSNRWVSRARAKRIWTQLCASTSSYTSTLAALQPVLRTRPRRLCPRCPWSVSFPQPHMPSFSQSRGGPRPLLLPTWGCSGCLLLDDWRCGPICWEMRHRLVWERRPLGLRLQQLRRKRRRRVQRACASHDRAVLLPPNSNASDSPQRLGVRDRGMYRNEGSLTTLSA
jgi:hypothetical protein